MTYLVTLTVSSFICLQNRSRTIMTPFWPELYVLREDVSRINNPLRDPESHLGNILRNYHRKQETENVFLMKCPRNKAVLTPAEIKHNLRKFCLPASHEGPCLT